MEKDMIYYRDGSLLIRELREADIPILVDEFTKQGWHPCADTYMMRLGDEAQGKCITFIAEYYGSPVGAVYLYLGCEEGPFAESGLPMIVDLVVLQKYQCKGIGSRLMDAAEKAAAEHAAAVVLGVGLCGEYGSAQRMYIRRGYIPDGSGVWYDGKRCIQYETQCTIDDDLLLYLSKKLR